MEFRWWNMSIEYYFILFFSTSWSYIVKASYLSISINVFLGCFISMCFLYIAILLWLIQFSLVGLPRVIFPAEVKMRICSWCFLGVNCWPCFVHLISNKFSLFKLQYFPKTEKYVPLFTGGDDSEIVDTRNRLRKQIEDRLIAAAASGKDLEGLLIN